ncbi:putative LysR-family transcriptional regulator [Actinoplanes missouriensis 431]|uniref:Putative LysR-family transcriptional regulator n=1 Tax=Actinoplanes missouriensis (strain ATCC 14538 / DSM 43046 / CBS 188.64 / JCM 3121 / NBRC 102363 / NCIMB 12654 / NRRL B-3342 / UNCC 431) TaxID=512565 RepID=I0H4Q4_ACTM4|nr:LysR family transcriptional regulator [Actinoplanes missouriensis]BAL87991.1 putative LysR-family transcriptional regulator [Actinoplanes missouriensis 431]
MDVDTRLLRSFVAVAEEGTLTRAAERLFISQPALTKQVRQLEARLGVTLFRRTRIGMTLTAAGEALVQRAPALLAACDEALSATKGAASREARLLRIGFLANAANEATPDIIGRFRRIRPEWQVRMSQANWSNPSAGLADGEVDAALLRLPFPGQERFRVEVLLTEPRWVALAAAHPLARCAAIPFARLWDEPFVAAPPETGRWRDYWLATDERDGRPVRIGATTDQPDDWLQAIANGYGVALAPASAARFYARPGVVYRPVDGVSPSRVAVVWPPSADTDPVIHDFVRCCLAAAAARPTG